MKRLAILGAGGHGKVMAEIAELSGWSEVVFFDDAWPERQLNGRWPVSGNSAMLLEQLSCIDGVIVGIGNNQARHDKQSQLAQANAPLVSLIHPQAVISRYCVLGVGSVAMAGVVVNVDARIGCGTILNTGCSIEHDNILGNFVHVSPGARLAGGVITGDLSWIGTGASVRQMIRIGSRAVIGAGAVVVKSVIDGAVVAGVPARSLDQDALDGPVSHTD